MNKQDYDILNILLQKSFINQRTLAKDSGYSLGAVNKTLKVLTEENYIDDNGQPTEKTQKELLKKQPKNAIILAAGFGMRMIPINLEMPKALLEINGEVLIERIIRQLHEAGIYNISVVVGFMKEHFEYLIDDFGVELIVNEQYSVKNNLYSVKLVCDKLENSYIIPCDIWCASNPFSQTEFYSWYMVSDFIDQDSTVHVNRKNELVSIKPGIGGNQMIGISYLLKEEAEQVRSNIEFLSNSTENNSLFWEEALFKNGKMITAAKVISSNQAVEINTYEQLREVDSNSNHLNSEVIDIISTALQVDKNEISNITTLKKGMTNRSFLFTVREKRYIMRIPGEGTDQLINRQQEAAIYQKIQSQNICDDPIYLNPENGYKITAFWENSRNCDPSSPEDVKNCLEKLRTIHNLNLQVEHEFNLFKQIDFYESLWGNTDSVYRDYTKTKQHVFSLKPFVDRHADKKVLTHIDAIPDNFLFIPAEDGSENLRLLDWEYAGMQDPHVDIAMFCIYCFYNREQIDSVIDFYFHGMCPAATRIKIYCYISICGLLWSNWCEYKRNLGVEFGEYSLRQYRYAKEYYKLASEEIKLLGENDHE